MKPISSTNDLLNWPCDIVTDATHFFESPAAYYIKIKNLNMPKILMNMDVFTKLQDPTRKISECGLLIGQFCQARDGEFTLVDRLCGFDKTFGQVASLAKGTIWDCSAVRKLDIHPLQIVGWYHVHRESRRCLTSQELEFHSQFVRPLHVGVVYAESTLQPNITAWTTMCGSTGVFLYSPNPSFYSVLGLDEESKLENRPTRTTIQLPDGSRWSYEVAKAASRL